jgi:hypothetical protein
MGSADSASRSAFLPEVTHDIFVSYAHVDNLPPWPGSKAQGWVDRFDGQLQTVLWQKLGKCADVWIDRTKLKRADEISPTISSAVDGSALFLVLISNRYLISESCQQEVEWIQQRVDRSGVRVFPVLLYNIPNDERPSICRNMPGFAFYRDGPGHSQPIDPVKQPGPFTRALDKLADELVDHLKKLRSAAPAPVDTSPDVPPYRAFLTATPGMRLRQKVRLRQALRGEGIEVLEEAVPPPYEVSKHDAAMKRILNTVDLAIHLIDEQAGPQLEGAEDRCFPEEQCRLAWEHERRQLVILPAVLNLNSVEVPSHRAFLDKLQQGVWPGGASREELTVARVLEEGEIPKLILRERQRASAARIAHSEGSRSVFVDLQPQDLASVAPLVKFLEKNNLDPITIPSSGAPRVLSGGVLAELAARAAAIIIVYGSSKLDWVKSRAQTAYQLIIEKELRFRPIVYAAPPAKSLSGLEFLQCAVVDCTSDFNEGSLASAMKGYSL